MASSNQSIPTVIANLDGINTTVNLRDWLNTRLSPFLKKAIIESLESEAQYPLQWLGEHLIQQSIMFEGNADTTNIKERFLYKHDISPSPAQNQNVQPTQPTQPVAPQQAQADSTPSNVQATAPPASIPEQAMADTDMAAGSGDHSHSQNGTPVLNINGAAQNTARIQEQDTEMANAS